MPSASSANKGTPARGKKPQPGRTAIVLAAGQGKRMRSRLAKVLHPVCGRPMIAYVVQAAVRAGCDTVIVVVSPDEDAGEAIRQAITTHCADLGQPRAGGKKGQNKAKSGQSEVKMVFAVQESPRGTADAVKAGLSKLRGKEGQVLILAGDVPLIQSSTLKRLGKLGARHRLAMISAHVADATGYGRILRHPDTPTAMLGIREHKDCSAAELAIDEINSGIYEVELGFLRSALRQVGSGNSQGEYYLTDIVELAASSARSVADSPVALVLGDDSEVQGVNDRMQLAEVEIAMRQRIVLGFMGAGVSFIDPNTAIIDAGVRIAKDACIGPSVQLRGTTHVGTGAVVDGPTVVIDSSLGAACQVRSFSHIEGATVAKQAIIGPFARLRPGANLEAEAHIGNFVEVKNSTIGKGAKANHLAYIGDADVGARSNIGAGTITCNYDGANKHRTTIGEGVFIGSNSTLVAPVRIDKGAYVAAGSTITKPVAADALAFGRARQMERQGFARTIRLRQARNKKSKK